MEWSPEACCCDVPATTTPQDLQKLPKYEYDALPPEEAFRVFELHQGAGDDSIRGRLEIIGPETIIPEYWAISYAWGTSDKPHLIECDDRRLPVTCNLFSALRRVRDESQMVCLWADAICIDQSSSEQSQKERAAQVRYMDKIFFFARAVLTDLGPLAEERYREALELFVFTAQDGKDTTFEEALQYEVESSAEEGINVNNFDSARQFCEHQWFNRLWMIQEYVLAEAHYIILRKNDQGGFQHRGIESLESDQDCRTQSPIATTEPAADHHQRESSGLGVSELEPHIRKASEISIEDSHGQKHPQNEPLEHHDPDYLQHTLPDRPDSGSGGPYFYLTTYRLDELLRGISRTIRYLRRAHSPVDKMEDDRGGFILRSFGTLLERLNTFKSLRQASTDRETPELPLSRLLQDTLYFRKTAPLDTVYALLGVMRQKEAAKIEVNYNLNPAQLSSMISWQLVDQGEIRVLLYHLAAYDKSHVASWMLDVEREDEANGPDHDFVRSSSFAAGGDGQMLATGCGIEGLLLVSGRLVDMIVEISDVCPEDPCSGDQLRRGWLETHWNQSWRKWLERTRQLTVQSATARAAINETDRYLAWARTVVCEGTLSGHDDDIGRLSGSSEILRHSLAHLLWHSHPEKNYPEYFMTSFRTPFTAEEIARKASVFAIHAMLCCAGKRFCITTRGLPGLVPRDAQVGDVVAVLTGGPLPMILREHSESSFRVIGAAFIEFLMHGEALEMPDLAEAIIGLE